MPWYRLEFFERLRASLEGHGVELDLAHGGVPAYAEGRGDDRRLDWAHPLAERRLGLGGRSITFREIWKPALTADLLVVEDGLRNLDTWAYLAARKPKRRPTAFWGHGRTTDKTVTGPEAALKRFLVKRGDWWFAYTQGTADHLSALGIPPAKVSVLDNTFDTEELARAAAGVETAEVDRLIGELGLTRGHSALYLGGLSRSKNLELLIEASRIVAAEDPLFRVVIAGAGPDRQRLESLASGAPVVFAGPVFDARRKAVLASACDFMALPGLVGLAAVDSFVLGLPAVAVAPWTHCPEFEYLRPGVNSLVVAPSAIAYAGALASLVSDPGLLRRLREGCAEDAGRYTLEAMVESFSSGAIEALASG